MRKHKEKKLTGPVRQSGTGVRSRNVQQRRHTMRSDSALVCSDGSTGRKGISDREEVRGRVGEARAEGCEGCSAR
jgi:hypothetical protein